MAGAEKQIDEDRRLRGASSWQAKPRQTGKRLGEDIVSYLEQHNRAFEKNASLLDLWPQVVPEFLLAYCQPDKRVGNTLYVQVMPGPYMHQLQTMTGELLNKIKELSPRCGIQKIRLIPKQ